MDDRAHSEIADRSLLIRRNTRNLKKNKKMRRVIRIEKTSRKTRKMDREPHTARRDDARD